MSTHGAPASVSVADRPPLPPKNAVAAKVLTTAGATARVLVRSKARAPFPLLGLRQLARLPPPLIAADAMVAKWVWVAVSVCVADATVFVGRLDQRGQLLPRTIIVTAATLVCRA